MATAGTTVGTRPVGSAQSVPVRRGKTGAYIQEVLALTRRWFLRLRRERMSLFFGLAQPALWLVLFGGTLRHAVNRSVFNAPDYTTFMLGGIIVFTVVGNSVSGAVPLLFDKETGYLTKMMTAPISRSSLIVSRFLFQTAMSSAQCIVILLVGLALGVHIKAGVPGVAVILAASGLLGMALTAAFLTLAYMLKSHADFFGVTGFITLPLLFVSSAFAPVSAMPGWMRTLAQVNPLTHAIDAMRGLVIEGWTSALLGDLAILAGFACACLAVGTYSFRSQTK